MEILMRKCGSPSIRRRIRTIIYANHIIKYKLYITLYYTIVLGYRDINCVLNNVNSLSDKWKNLRKQYLINISQTAINHKDVEQIDELYKGSNYIESAIKILDKDDSCNILNQLLTHLI
jgi:hypothetical protein